MGKQVPTEIIPHALIMRKNKNRENKGLLSFLFTTFMKKNAEEIAQERIEAAKTELLTLQNRVTELQCPNEKAKYSKEDFDSLLEDIEKKIDGLQKEITKNRHLKLEFYE